jgi:hypothetical protein
MSFEQPKKNLPNLIKSIALSALVAAGGLNAKAQTGTQMPLQPRRSIPTMPQDSADAPVMIDPDGYEKQPVQRSEAQEMQDMIDALVEIAKKKFKDETGEVPNEDMILMLREQIIQELQEKEETSSTGPAA